MIWTSRRSVPGVSFRNRLTAQPPALLLETFSMPSTCRSSRPLQGQSFAPAPRPPTPRLVLASAGIQRMHKQQIMLWCVIVPPKKRKRWACSSMQLIAEYFKRATTQQIARHSVCHRSSMCKSKHRKWLKTSHLVFSLKMMPRKIIVVKNQYRNHFKYHLLKTIEYLNETSF